MEKPSNVLYTGLPTPNVTLWNVGWGIRGGGQDVFIVKTMVSRTRSPDLSELDPPWEGF